MYELGNEIQRKREVFKDKNYNAKLIVHKNVFSNFISSHTKLAHNEASEYNTKLNLYKR